jgi:outer membrane murein-binding lipoprotein Lpp
MRGKGDEEKIVITRRASPRKGRTVLSGLLACAVLNGCTQVKQIMGTENCNDPAMIPAQQKLCKDDATFNQTVAGGAIIGGIVGAGTGAIACAMAKGANPLICAAVGLGVGLFAGGVTGYVVAKKQEAARNHVRAIDGVTADIRQQNLNIRGEVAAAQQVTYHARQRLTQIGAQERAGSINTAQARTERDRFERDSAHLDDLIKERQKEVDNFQGAGQQVNQNSRDYGRELAEMQRNVNALRQQKDALDHAIQESG